IGIGWSKLQWLVAALGVGLGFGLQEIFANFISGLIILFEKPIRIGDTVTIRDLTGSVTKINTRATTITKYLLMLIGGLVGFSMIGIGWSKLQWLVAALGVGLGFGLQEIFANFISGLIILFEKPIRIGD
ncbi:mechanosensitive ion channel domain-containing protein, partial [Escherichia coli]|uniref:mechanosensitive ion channel domain-containing protein n=1 Tax=Escherichia coli TaxID=562 RepID=UPI00301DF78E